MVVAFKQIFCSKKKTNKQTKHNKTKQKQKQKQKKKTSLVYFDYFLLYFSTSKSYYFSTSNSFSNYFNKLINILSMFSFLFNTFINCYLGLVVSYIRDLYPQYNFSITASWWGSRYACKQLQVQISPTCPRFHTQTLWHAILRFFVSVFDRVYGQWSVLLFSLGKLVNGYIRHCGGSLAILAGGLRLVNFSMDVLETSQQKIMD